MAYIKQQVLHERKLKDRTIIITEDGDVEINPSSGSVTINGDLSVTGASSGPTNDLVFYVSLEGSDSNTGASSGSSGAKRTIKAAVEAAPEGATIHIAPGDYQEENPITLKKRQTVRGDSLRNTRIFPNNNTQTIFYVDDACYLFQLTFRGLRDPGWCVEIKPDALVTTSPYVQNCSNINGPWLNDGTEFIPFETVQIDNVEPGNKPIINDGTVPLGKRVNETGGGNGMKVDGDQYHPDSLVRSMVADAFTQIAQGAVGFEITNFGYTQIVSCFSVFTRIGFLTTNGGYLSISNSVSDFGTYGVIADGKDPDPYTATYPTTNYFSEVGSVTMVSTGSGYTDTDPPSVVFDTPTGINPVTATGTAIIDNNSGEVVGVSITESGSGYEVVPNVTFTGGTFSSAATGDVNLLKNFTIQIDGLRDRPQIGSVVSFDDDNIEYYVTNTETLSEPFFYNEGKCRRDMALILDAVLGDAVLSTDYQSIVAGRTYTQSVAAIVVDRQRDETLFGIERLKQNMLATLPAADATNTVIRGIITNRIDTIKQIISDSIVPNHSLTDLATIDQARIDAKDNINLNRDFIIEEITAWIDINFANLEYNESTCRRDTELIINAIYRDILLDTNHNSIVAGLAYRRGTASYVDQEQLPATILAVRQLKTLLATELADNATAVSRSNDRMDTVLEIMEFGVLPSEGQYFTNPTGVETDLESAKNQLINNKEFLQAEVIAYINDQIANAIVGSIWEGFVYDQDKCSRDVGYIVDGVIHDLLYGGNRSTLISARSYYSSGQIQIDGQVAPTVDSFEHLKTVAASIIEGVAVTPTSGNVETQDLSGTYGTSVETDKTDILFDIVIDAIDLGLTSTPANQNPELDWVSEPYFDVVRKIITNLNTIQDGVIDYITNDIQGFSYNVNVCERDVNYIVDAVIYDTMYGGNLQTKRAAAAYYNNAVIEGQEGFTEFSYKHLASVLSDIVQNNLIPNPAAATGAVYTQNVSGTASTLEVGSEYQILVDKIAEVIRLGTDDTPESIGHDYAGLADVTLNGKRQIVLADEQYIIDTSIDELNDEYGGSSNITIFPGIITVRETQQGQFQNVSTISTSGHQFEYVGAGITYNALPFFGGVPVAGNEFVELNGGKVFAGGVTDQIGNFKVGNFFTVNALTGGITLDANELDLAGASSIGPFRRSGVPVGVAVREVSNDVNLIASTGVQDQSTVPTQYAISQYINERYLGLGGGTLTGGLDIQSGNITLAGDLEIQGGDITTNKAYFNIVNDVAEYVNIGNEASQITLGSDGGKVIISNELQVNSSMFVGADGSSSSKIDSDANTFDLLNTQVDVINFGGQASLIEIGNASSTVNLGNDLNIQGGFSTYGDIDILGGDDSTPRSITTESEVFNLVNETAQTVNFAGAADTIIIGAETGTTTVRTHAVIEGNLTIQGYDESPAALIDSGASTFNIAGSPVNVGFATNAQDIEIGATTGETNIRNNLVLDSNIAVNGTELTSTSLALDVFNTTVQTVNMFSDATEINVGASESIITFNADQLIVNGIEALQLPVGTTLERPIAVTGQIRYNTTDTTFEGYDGVAWGSLGGVKDVDQDTYISPEDNPGDDNDQLKFIITDVQRFILESSAAEFDSTVLTVSLNATTTSTDDQTGALVVAGGVGIAENLHVGGYIGAESNLLNITNSSADKIFIAADTIESSTPFKVIVEDADVTNIVRPFTFAHYNTSGTPQIGSGVGIAFEHESTSANIELVGAIDIESTDLTSSSEDYDLVFKTMAEGTPVSERLRLSGTLAEFTTNLLVDGTLTVSGNLEAAAFKGSIFAEDSTLMVDANNNTITAESIVTDNLIVTSPISVEYGGTGRNEITQDGIVYGNGTSSAGVTDAAGTSDVTESFQILTVTSDSDSTPVWTTTLDGGSFGGAEGGGGVTSDPDGTLVVGTSIRFNDFSVVVASETILATNLETEIDSFDYATYRTSKATIQITDTVTGEYQITEIMIVHNDVTAFTTTFGTIYTGSAPLATFDADIDNAECRILATGTSANQTKYKIQRTSITV